ncbi:unnamed protein product [Ectocarpus sp. 12 AP-2014]
MACMGSVSSPLSAIQGSRQSERHQACEASSKCEIRHMSRNKTALRPLVRSSAGRSLGGRRAMLALISVAHLDVVEGKWMIKFPSGFRCVWNDLPHCLQFAILFLATLSLFTKALEDVSRARVTYPNLVIDLDADRRQVVFYIAGWMLSSALTRVNRDHRLRSSVMPFVNIHKYATAEAFVEAHPSYKGLEFEVADRNVCWHGKGLFFPSAPFFEFVYTLERGYHHALKNPLLLATFLGNLPTEIFNVLSSAAAVKDAWANCVRIVGGGGAADEDVAGSSTNFLLHVAKVAQVSHRRVYETPF